MASKSMIVGDAVKLRKDVLPHVTAIDAPVFPLVGEGRQLHRVFRGYLWVRLRCDPPVCSTPLKSLCQGT